MPDAPTLAQCVAAVLSEVPDVETAELAVDTLIGAAMLFPAERFDEDCHSCELPVRDHAVDGRHPHEVIADLVAFIVKGLGGCECWNDPESLLRSIQYGIDHDSATCGCACHQAA